MPKASPAFQFYAADWLADAEVQMLSLEEEGAYIRLLAYCWREGSLPNDTVKLSRLAKGASLEVIRVVEPLFNQHPTDATRLVHGRLEMERQKQLDWKEKSSRGGRRSAKTRDFEARDNGGSSSECKGGSTTLAEVVEPPYQPNGNTSFSSSSSKEQILKEPPFTRDAREEPPEPGGYHDAMPPIAMAAEMLLRTAIPFDVPLRDLVSQSIVGIARTEDVMLHKAADLLEARIRAAQLGGATVNRFWFADGRWRPGGIRGSTEGNRKSPTIERNASMRDALAKAAIAQGNGSADDAVAADSG